LGSGHRDVCGKGVEAAALTGLARHTLRALFEVASPSDALGELNRALLRERLDGRFCTVAYVNIEPDPQGGARLTLACGGHPLPHFIAGDGSTSLVGRYGTLIGVTEDPRIEDVEIRLSPGEAIVLFTDGILRKGRGVR
jgi:serine phosphatase RsbU (regulator of sigma subunit)